MDPTVLAKAHSGIAILVFVFYIIRGALMLAGSAKVRSLILTAISHSLVLILALMGLYTAYLKGIPFSNGFVLTKITCLISFVILGGIAVKQGLTKGVALFLWLLGLAAVSYAWLLGKQLAPAFF